MIFVCFILLYIATVASSLIPIPNIGYTQVCYDFVCLEALTNDARRSEVILIGLLSHDIQKDAYCSLYLGGILDLFDVPELAVNTVIFQAPTGMSLEYAGARMIQMLPARSIFVSHEHGMSSFGIRYLEQLRKLGIGPRIVFHMNHERPWNVYDRSDLNYIYNSTERLIESYKLHPLVMRNYYYEPLLGHSQYIPLGAPYYSHLVGISTPSAEFFNASQKAASQRSFYCHFAGRSKYSTTMVDNTVIEMSSDEPHIQTRHRLMSLSSEGKLGGCVAESSDNIQEIVGQEAFYRSYIQKMTETAFALCPAGNNPETFRIYEALEVGAIPILVRPEPDQDFLKYDLWQTYPGPVLSSWTELESFMQSMTPSKADQLQLRVIEWYKDFKVQMKRRARSLLYQVMEGVSNLTPDDRASGKAQTVSHFEEYEQPDQHQQSQTTAVDGSDQNIATLDSILQHLYSQMETLHYRLSEVERELSASLQREQKLLTILHEKKII